MSNEIRKRSEIAVGDVVIVKVNNVERDCEAVFLSVEQVEPDLRALTDLDIDEWLLDREPKPGERFKARVTDLFGSLYRSLDFIHVDLLEKL